MSRWMIEKSGTGIEKSGTGVEKSGTGIEKSGTGIEKSGTGIRRLAIACSMALMAAPAFAGSTPEGFPQISVFGKQVVASWHFDGSVFSAVGDLSGKFGVMDLIEIRRPDIGSGLDVTGGGTGFEVTGGGTGLEVTGGGTGLEVTGGGTGLEVTGGGTGIQVTGGGTGIQVTGGGTGVQVTGGGTGIQVTGGGTGLLVTGGGTGTQVTGGGTGVQVTGGGTGVQVTGGGTGLLVTGGGTGAEGLSITLPDGTGLQMEIEMGCGSARVTILDSTFAPVVSFDNVPVMGGSFCGDGPGAGFGLDRGELQ